MRLVRKRKFFRRVKGIDRQCVYNVRVITWETDSGLRTKITFRQFSILCVNISYTHAYSALMWRLFFDYSEVKEKVRYSRASFPFCTVYNKRRTESSKYISPIGNIQETMFNFNSRLSCLKHFISKYFKRGVSGRRYRQMYRSRQIFVIIIQIFISR